MKKPEYLTDEEASTLPIAGVTAWMAINGMRPLGQAGGKGEKVLIQGTGGVAVNGLLIAKASGAEGTNFHFSTPYFLENEKLMCNSHYHLFLRCKVRTRKETWRRQDNKLPH